MEMPTLRRTGTTILMMRWTLTRPQRVRGKGRLGS